MYTDRLRTMKYTSPSGAEFTLNFDGLARTGGKKAPVTEFPGQDQGAVQDLGETTTTFPVECYITGADYDLEANRFWEALAERGPAKLDHPRWGNLNVLPTTREQREEFVDGAGQAIFSITFIRATLEQFEFPTVTEDTTALTQADVETAATAVVETAPETPEETRSLQKFKEWLVDLLDPIVEVYDQITEITDEIRTEITQAVADIKTDIDSLVNNTAELMEDMLYLYRLPARLEISIKNKIEGYIKIYNILVSAVVETTEKYGSWFGLMAVENLAADAVAAADSTTEGDIPTNAGAGEIIEAMSGLLDDIRGTIEDLEAAGDFSASYEMLMTMELAFSSAINGLIKRALTLPSEQRITLTREVTPLQLCYETYGGIDRLEEFIEYNNFTGDELLLLPRGKEVRWYV